MISFIIPAWNEDVYLGRTLDAITAAAGHTGEPFEVVVVDDASADRTAAIARLHGARVVSVEHHQISKVRNAGAAAATGTELIFVDADTLPTASAVSAAVQAMRSGAVGGGCSFQFDAAPGWISYLVPLGTWIFRQCGYVGGCFLFCTRKAFEQIGGFSEQHYAAEEFIFLDHLRQIGTVIFPPHSVITSARKLKCRSIRQSAWILFRLLALGPDAFRNRRSLDYWYVREAAKLPLRRPVPSRQLET
jgi:glycosyltransferase involved in cell wall biosynthesis